MRSVATVAVLVVSSLVTVSSGGDPPVWRLGSVELSERLGTVPAPTCNGPFGATLFGNAVAPAGDFDGDGVRDLFVTAPGSGAQLTDHELVLLLMNADGTVRERREVLTGPFASSVGAYSLALVGDRDGNGVVDLAFGSPNDRQVELVLLDASGAGQEGATHVEALTFTLGNSLAYLGDLGGGVDLLAAGAPDPLSVGLIRLLAVGSEDLAAVATITEGVGGFGGDLDPGDGFATSLASLGDLDGDGVADLAVGAPRDDDGGTDRGAIWILFLNPDASVKSWTKISSTAGGFGGALADGARLTSGAGSLAVFGTDGLDAVGDLDGDGVCDLAAVANPSPGQAEGALWLLFLNRDGTVKDQLAIRSGSEVPSALAALGDLDGNGTTELAVGTPLLPGVACLFGGGVVVLFLGPPPRATVAFRNAANPVSFRAEPPVLGRTVTFEVDLATTGHSQALVFGFDSPASVPLGASGTLLCLDLGGSGLLIDTGFHPGPLASIPFAVPCDLELLGLGICAQALHAFGVTPFALSNAQDLVIGVRGEHPWREVRRGPQLAR